MLRKRQEEVLLVGKVCVDNVKCTLIVKQVNAFRTILIHSNIIKCLKILLIINIRTFDTKKEINMNAWAGIYFLA